MSDAGMDMLSDMPLSMRSDSPTVATGHTAMQLDMTDFTRTTDKTLALPQALLNRTNRTTRRTRTLIQALIGTDDNRRCDECWRTFLTMKRLKIHVSQHFTVTFCPCGVHHFYRDAICDTKGLKTVIPDIYTKSTRTHTLNLGTWFYLMWLTQTADRP